MATTETTAGFEVTQSETIFYEKRDRIAWITLNRPERMNALGRELGQARARALKDASEDDDILVVIFTGAGGRAFSGRRRPKGGGPRRTTPELVLTRHHGPSSASAKTNAPSP